MRPERGLAGGVLLLAFQAGVLIAADNLIANGSFEAGEVFASHWERPNGLTVEFVVEGGRGRIVRMDTQVERAQVLAWLATFAADPTAPVPEKRRVSQGSFASVGAFEGVALDSDLIDVAPGQNYKLSVDMRGAGPAVAWIKGFMPHPRRDMLVDAYQTRLVADGIQATEWRTFTIGFNPTARTPKVEKMKVRLYAYWPNGLYFFDNVRLEKISQEEMDELVRARERK